MKRPALRIEINLQDDLPILVGKMFGFNRTEGTKEEIFKSFAKR